jgi:hypothetical protein
MTVDLFFKDVLGDQAVSENFETWVVVYTAVALKLLTPSR